MTKKKAAKKEAKKSGEQLDLIEVAPKEVKPIIKAAREYAKHRDARIAVGKKEAEHKQKVIELVKAANLQPLKGGLIKFKYNGVTVSITPRDELVKVKDEKAEE